MLLEKGILGEAEYGSFLHRVVLVKGQDDRPAQSGQTYQLCTNLGQLTATL